MAKKAPSAQKRFFNALETTSLTEEEKADIRARAHKKVEEERRAADEEVFFEQALLEARAVYDPALGFQDVLIDLPGHAVHILIDGKQFMHGMVYEVPTPVAATINEIIHRTWLHEKEIGGANRQHYREPRNIKLNRYSENITTRALMGHR